MSEHDKLANYKIIIFRNQSEGMRSMHGCAPLAMHCSKVSLSKKNFQYTRELLFRQNSVHVEDTFQDRIVSQITPQPAEKLAEIFVGIVIALYKYAAECTSGSSGLEICGRVRSTSRIVVLLKVALKRRIRSVRRRLISKSGPSVEVEVIIVGRNTLLATPDAPADQGNAAK
jgi:hypothetical protein